MGLIDTALTGTLPELRDKERQLRAAANGEGIEYTVADFGALRSQSDTLKILGYRDQDYAAYVAAQQRAGKPIASKNTFRPIAPYGSSYHNYGAAFDARVTRVPAGSTASAATARLGALGESVGLRWGGHFPAGEIDPPHFELAISLPDAVTRWAAWQAAQRGETPTEIAALVQSTIAIPGVQMAVERVSSLPAAMARAAAIPTAHRAITVGAAVVAGLLLYVVVQRFGSGRD